MGKIDEGETPAHAAAREVEEETGWRPAQLRPLAYAQPAAGIMDAAHHLFVAEGATQIGRPADAFESSRIEWIPLADAPALIAKREIVSNSTMTALLYLFAVPPK